MGIPILIIGKSGSGKSFSLNTLNPEDVVLIQCLKKKLPFKSTNWEDCNEENPKGSIIISDDYKVIKRIIKNAPNKGKKIIIVDDFQYLIANEFMKRLNEKGYDKFNELAKHTWEVIMEAINSPNDSRIYFLSHSEETETNEIKCKTIGRLLDDKITLEGMFTIVLRSNKDVNEYVFYTQTNGHDTCKSPYKLFDDYIIANDLKYIDDKVCEYYGIGDKPQNV